MEHWTQVLLCVSCGRGSYDVPRGDNPERRRLLREYRDTDCMDGAWPLDLESLNELGEAGEDLADVGTASEDIDFAGIDGSPVLTATDVETDSGVEYEDERRALAGDGPDPWKGRR